MLLLVDGCLLMLSLLLCLRSPVLFLEPVRRDIEIEINTVMLPFSVPKSFSSGIDILMLRASAAGFCNVFGFVEDL